MCVLFQIEVRNLVRGHEKISTQENLDRTWWHKRLKENNVKVKWKVGVGTQVIGCNTG